MKVFLGGTTNNSNWRDELIKQINCDYFNPVVKNWDASAQQREIEERQTSDYVLYVITPKMMGVYSIFEVTEDAITNGNKTIFCVLEKDDDQTFNEHQIKSLNMGKQMLSKYTKFICNDLEEVANLLNMLNDFYIAMESVE